MSATSILKLQKAGFSTAQVEALAEFMDTAAASKSDLEATEHRLETKIIEAKAELFKTMVTATTLFRDAASTLSLWAGLQATSHPAGSPDPIRSVRSMAARYG